jgi:hypothetical protein
LDALRFGTIEAAVRRSLARLPKKSVAEAENVLAALAIGLMPNATETAKRSTSRPPPK